MKKYIIEVVYEHIERSLYEYKATFGSDHLMMLSGGTFAILTNDLKRAYEYCNIFKGKLYLTEKIADNYAIERSFKFMRGEKL